MLATNPRGFPCNPFKRTVLAACFSWPSVVLLSHSRAGEYVIRCKYFLLAQVQLKILSAGIRDILRNKERKEKESCMKRSRHEALD